MRGAHCRIARSRPSVDRMSSAAGSILMPPGSSQSEAARSDEEKRGARDHRTDRVPELPRCRAGLPYSLCASAHKRKGEPDYVQHSGGDHRIPGIAGILARVDHGRPSAARGREARVPRRPRPREAAGTG